MIKKYTKQYFRLFIKTYLTYIHLITKYPFYKPKIDVNCVLAISKHKKG